MTRPSPVSRLPRVGTTIFSVMSHLALKHGAVNLGQGFPDFNCDDRLQQCLADAVRAGQNQYAPMTGVPALRSAIAEKNASLYGHRYDPETEITVTAGATQAIMASVLALVHPGDDVVVLEPTYDSYVPSIELAGGRPVYVPLDAARGYAPDWEHLRAAITPEPRKTQLLSFPCLKHLLLASEARRKSFRKERKDSGQAGMTDKKISTWRLFLASDYFRKTMT